MIPKIIHYCWLSDDPLPQKIRFCIDSWKRTMPDYEIRLWDFNRFPKDKSIWVGEAFDAKKYAFAADYIRFYALYHEGGIYLDSDVETLASFDRFLHLPYMFGRESDSGEIEAAVIGAQAKLPQLKSMVDYYEGRHFIMPGGKYDTLAAPLVMRKVLGSGYTYHTIQSVEEFNDGPGRLNLFPSDYFSPVHLTTMKLEKTPRTVAIHHFAGTWKPTRYRMKKNLQKFLGHRITSFIVKTKRLVKGCSRF